MQIDKLLEIDARYAAKIRETVAETQRAIEDVARTGGAADALAELELAFVKQSMTDELRHKIGEARGRGFDAAKAGRTREENPFLENSDQYLFWYKGWCQGNNIMPFTEIPMAKLFELDRVVRHFSRDFRLVHLIESIARRAQRSEGDTTPWETLDLYVKKQYLVQAVTLLTALMDVPGETQDKLPSPGPLPLMQINELLDEERRNLGKMG